MSLIAAFARQPGEAGTRRAGIRQFVCSGFCRFGGMSAGEAQLMLQLEWYRRTCERSAGMGLTPLGTTIFPFVPLNLTGISCSPCDYAPIQNDSGPFKDNDWSLC